MLPAGVSDEAKHGAEAQTRHQCTAHRHCLCCQAISESEFSGFIFIIHNNTSIHSVLDSVVPGA